MKLAPSGVGAEPRKLALLGAILAVGGLVYWFQNRSDGSVSANVAPAAVAADPAPLQPLPGPPAQAPSPAQPAPPALDPAPGSPQTSSTERRAPLGGSGTDSWVPSMKKPDGLDVSKIDPRINLDLLAKVREVPLEGGSSSLFDYSKPPEPPAPKVTIQPKAVPVPLPTAKVNAAPAPPLKPVPPPPPPIPFKYYGYAGKPTNGPLQGLFIEGDPANGTIYAKSEGETIQNRYKIVRIGIRSAEVEDTQSHHQETLHMPEDQP